ncbi:MAG TPA: Gfo/Idh/MocA family oxidoreductase, partial [Gemmatimonadaceae bacterium]|nr:Gfo/Idh/MocA family oxidoreductase [Gemmatimonadaceae bacterium]
MALGIGFIGSGFNARFHIQSFTGVRDADVRGVWSPNAANAKSTAALARDLEVGDARAYNSIRAMVSDPAIDAIWLCGPNHARIDNVEEIVGAMEDGAELRGVACEKPLARNVAEAKTVARLARRARLNTGYLENQLFAPEVTRGKELVWARGAALTGRPYLARAAEEHSGPHMPWFWQGSLQGGGVLNDMMCHSVEVVRDLLTRPGDPRSSIRPVRISAHIASLKWTRPVYAKRLSVAMGKGVDYGTAPAEDFARATIEYLSDDGERLIGEVTTSWSFVGAGLRLSAELLGPEYSMSWNTLDSGLKLFFSREV